MKKEVTFKTKQSLTLENSFSVIDRQDDVELEVTIGFHNNNTYGWFELFDIESGGEHWYAEGGLWFYKNEVTGYDGVFSLPECILNKLEEMGYNIDQVK